MRDIVDEAKAWLNATTFVASRKPVDGIINGLIAEVERLRTEINRPMGRSADEHLMVRNATNPIEAFNLFIQHWVPETWHAHLLDTDDNDAEHVRDTICYMRERLRPRRIETVAELDALATWSVVISTRNKIAWQKVEPRERITAGGWLCRDPIWPGITPPDLLINACGVDLLIWSPPEAQ